MRYKVSSLGRLSVTQISFDRFRLFVFMKQHCHKGATVSVLERVGRQIIPAFLLVIGIAILCYRLWVNNSYILGPRVALIICGIFAAGVQLIATLASPRFRRKDLLVSLNAAVLLASFAILRFAEYVTFDLLGIPMVTYDYYPGTQINAISACVAAVVVGALAFAPQNRLRGQDVQ